MKFELGICVTSNAVPRAAEAAEVLRRAVASPFFQGSSGDIVLEPKIVDLTSVPAGRLPVQVSSDMLHSALFEFTDLQFGPAAASKIGLLLAGAYAPRPDIFGLMFDQAFTPNSGLVPGLSAREGGAIFLSAIAAGRPQERDFFEEVAFTGVHELGHVFNLEHSAPNSFMASSAGRPTPFSFQGCAFAPAEQKWLANCSHSNSVWPGGSAFGEFGVLAANMATHPSLFKERRDVSLKIGMSQDHFWPFEPVELDVELSVTKGAAVVSDTLDPGYDTFCIWIEEPDGCRRRYRSPRHYCGSGSRLRITQAAPFRRDISIFGEAGAFTFRKVGVHQVFVTFESGHRRLKSNTLEVLVKAPADTEAYRRAREHLSHIDVAQTLYHRRLTTSRARKLSAMTDFCKAYPRSPASSMLHYALGRALASKAGRQRNIDLAKEAWGTAKLHLRQAARRKSLGDHRREKAEALLTTPEI